MRRVRCAPCRRREHERREHRVEAPRRVAEREREHELAQGHHSGELGEWVRGRAERLREERVLHVEAHARGRVAPVARELAAEEALE